MTDLRDLKQFYESVLNTVHDGLWVTDTDDRIIFFNHSMEIISGASAADILGLSVITDFPAETTGQLLPQYHQARNQLVPVAYEAAVVTPAGRHTVQAGWLTPRIVDDGFDGMICTIRDVTETRETERALNEAGARAQRILDITPAIIMALDRAGNITLLNQAGGFILDCDPLDVIGMNWFDTFLPEVNRDEVKGVFARLIAGELEAVEHYTNEIVTLRGRQNRQIQRI